MITIQSKFDLKQKIYITDLELQGTVVSMSWGIHGMQYQVVYYCDGERHIEWVFDFEIEEIK